MNMGFAGSTDEAASLRDDHPMATARATMAVPASPSLIDLEALTS